uniref:Secreted protein n=1 Tax=Romanomermis culicivorax TaxID=13658 RepID=A0A915JPN4_ROMCU
MLEISLSVSFKKSVICVAVALISDGAAGIGRADASDDGSSFAMLRSKISVSNRSSSAGSTSTLMGRSSSSSVAFPCGIPRRTQSGLTRTDCRYTCRDRWGNMVRVREYDSSNS